jgi:hypothetical protein
MIFVHDTPDSELDFLAVLSRTPSPCRSSTLGLRVSLSNIDDPVLVFIRTQLISAGYRKHFTAIGKVHYVSSQLQFIIQMFDQMSL